jgi:hypothetical protein
VAVARIYRKDLPRVTASRNRLGLSLSKHIRHRLIAKINSKRRSWAWGGVGGGGFSPPLPPPPPHHWGRPSNAFEPFFLLSRMLPFIFLVWLASCLAISLSKVIPHGSLCTHQRPYKMCVACIKEGQNGHHQAETNPSGLTQGLVTPSLKGTRPELERRFTQEQGSSRPEYHPPHP